MRHPRVNLAIEDVLDIADQKRQDLQPVKVMDATLSGRDLRARLIVEKSAEQLKNYFEATTHLMQVLARACGHSRLNQFCIDDLTTYKRDMAYLTGVRYGERRCNERQADQMKKR